MAIYIDNFNAPFGRMIMCHMVADTTAELIAMANKIGVNQKWIQYPGTANEHFDVALGNKKKALSLGAIEIGFRDYANFVNARKSGKHFTPRALAPSLFSPPDTSPSRSLSLSNGKGGPGRVK